MNDAGLPSPNFLAFVLFFNCFCIRESLTHVYSLTSLCKMLCCLSVMLSMSRQLRQHRRDNSGSRRSQHIDAEWDPALLRAPKHTAKPPTHASNPLIFSHNAIWVLVSQSVVLQQQQQQLQQQWLVWISSNIHQCQVMHWAACSSKSKQSGQVDGAWKASATSQLLTQLLHLFVAY